MTFNLNKNTSERYGNQIASFSKSMYTHINHEPQYKNCQKESGKRLSNLLCNEKILKKAIPSWKDTLGKSEFKEN